MDRFLSFKALIETETYDAVLPFSKDFLEIFKVTIMRRFLDGF